METNGVMEAFLVLLGFLAFDAYESYFNTKVYEAGRFLAAKALRLPCLWQRGTVGIYEYPHTAATRPRAMWIVRAMGSFANLMMAAVLFYVSWLCHYETTACIIVSNFALGGAIANIAMVFYNRTRNPPP